MTTSRRTSTCSAPRAVRAEREVAAEFRRARQAGRTADRTEPRAVAVRYDRATGRVEIDLRDDSFHAFPAENAEGLRGAPPELLEQVEIVANGFALRWPALDADFTVPGLLADRTGTARWTAKFGRAGGRSRSEAKARAARENGRKGGRPRKAGEAGG
jgi:hypothetical protein